MQEPANMALVRTCQDSAMKHVSITFQFHSMLILHPPIISAISSMPPIPPDEVAIGAIPVAVDAIDMPDIAIPVLVGAIDISISIDMIACTRNLLETKQRK